MKSGGSNFWTVLACSECGHGCNIEAGCTLALEAIPEGTGKSSPGTCLITAAHPCNAASVDQNLSSNEASSSKGSLASLQGAELDAASPYPLTRTQALVSGESSQVQE